MKMVSSLVVFLFEPSCMVANYRWIDNYGGVKPRLSIPTRGALCVLPLDIRQEANG